MDAKNIDFLQLLPKFMRNEADNQGLAAALSTMLQIRAGVCSSFAVWSAIDDLQETQLDDIARFFGVFWYNVEWSLEKKKECIRNSDMVRSRIGSKWALEKMLQDYFDDDGLIVEEWFDYNRNFPYHFRILTTKALDNTDDFYAILDRCKRSSQALDGVFAGFSLRGKIYTGIHGVAATETYRSLAQSDDAYYYYYIPVGAVYDSATYGAKVKQIQYYQALNGLPLATAKSLTQATTDWSDNPVPVVNISMRYTLANGVYVPAKTTATAIRAALTAKSLSWADYSFNGGKQYIRAAENKDGLLPIVTLPTPTADLRTGLTHHWALGDSAMSYASSVAGDTKTIGGFSDAVWSASGRIGGCVAGANISGGNYNNSDWPGYPFGPNRTLSLSLWLRMDSASASSHECGFMLGRLDTSGAAFVGFSADRKPCVFRAGPYEFVKGASALSVGWHHFVLVGNSGALTCYCDGSVFGTTTLTHQSAYSSAEFKFGRGGVSPSGCVGLSGAVDEISVWLNRALGPDEVDALYNGGSGQPFENWT